MKSLHSQAVSKSFMLSVGSKMNHSAAKFAVTTEKLLHAVRGSILQQCVPIAATKRRFRLSQRQTDLYIAATALQKQESNQ